MALPKPKAQNPSNIEQTNFWSLISRIDTLIGSLLAISAFLTLTGYISVHAYFSTFTNLPIRGVERTSYIIAGIYPMLHFFFLWVALKLFMFVRDISTKIIDYVSRFINLRITKILVYIVLGISISIYFWNYINWLWADQIRFITTMIYIVCLAILGSVLTNENTIKDDKAPLVESIKKFILNVLSYMENPLLIIKGFKENTTNKNIPILVIVLAFYLFFISQIYGSQLFSNIPINYNGGKPTSIQLIFEDNQLPNSLGIAISNTSQSEELCLLALLDSEILIISSDGNNSWLIPRTSVIGIIDTNNKAIC